MPDVTYTIYRRTTAVEVPHLGEDSNTPTEMLVHLGEQIETGPKRALAAWFDSLPYSEQVKLNGDATFIVVPTGNHHELSPKVEAQPRLVFS